MNQNSSMFNQFLKYIVVGGIASIVDISIFSIGVNVFNINHIISNSFSLMAGMIVNYFLSRKWVFNLQEHSLRDFLLFLLIGIIGFVLSNILLYILLDLKVLYIFLLSSNDKLIKPMAKLVVTGIVLFWNFIARRKLVFSWLNYKN